MLAIFSKEVSSFFGSPIAYVVITVFLVTVGLIVWVFPDSNVLDYGYADMGVFFNLTPFVLLFLVPAITMRTFAEEIRNGTLELLLTKPLRDMQLVLESCLPAGSWLPSRLPPRSSTISVSTSSGIRRAILIPLQYRARTSAFSCSAVRLRQWVYGFRR